MVAALPRKRCTASEALADPWIARRSTSGGSAGGAASASLPAAAAPLQGGRYSLAASPSPRIEYAQKCLVNLALKHGHAQTLFTKGDYLMSSTCGGLLADSVFLVTRGDLDVIEGGCAALDDSAGTSDGHTPTTVTTCVECAASGVIIGSTNLLVRQLVAVRPSTRRSSCKSSASCALPLLVAAPHHPLLTRCAAVLPYASISRSILT